jgi:hypothetical protein
MDAFEEPSGQATPSGSLSCSLLVAYLLILACAFAIPWRVATDSSWSQFLQWRAAGCSILGIFILWLAALPGSLLEFCHSGPGDGCLGAWIPSILILVYS